MRHSKLTDLYHEWTQKHPSAWNKELKKCLQKLNIAELFSNN